jgi:hypothetical protein
MGCAASWCGRSEYLGDQIVAFDNTEEARAAAADLERSRNAPVPRVMAATPAPRPTPAKPAFDELELVDSDEFEAISLAEPAPAVTSSSIPRSAASRES